MPEKLKSFLQNDAYFIASLLILVGVISFGLGRLSASEGVQPAPVNGGLQLLPTSDITRSVDIAANGAVVASKSGTKYHLFDCPGAKQMKPENRIEFASAALAQAAGYGPAANCPGL